MDHDADGRAVDLVSQMTLAEKIQLVTGYMGIPIDAHGVPEGNRVLTPEMTPPPGAIGSDGFVPGIPRLGIPALHLAGAGAGVTSLVARPGGESVAFPSPLAQTATWNRDLVREFGRRLGDEARAQGVNVVLAAANNLAIEPRSGRNFEFHGEDPVLSGTLVREELLGTQDQGVVASIKHFAGNFQETGRFVLNSVIDERSLREGELLAFEIALTDADIGAVMTSYNKLNGDYTSESYYLLTEVLKDEWGYRGWVMSDWGATHSTVKSAMAGLDQEFPHAHWFGAALMAAVAEGTVPLDRLDDMNRRILRSIIAVGLLDDERPRPLPAVEANLATAQRIAEEGIALLKNSGVLPISPEFSGTIAVIGSHADVAVPAGGGSAAVTPIGGSPVPVDTGALPVFWLPDSPLRALKAAFPCAQVLFDSGDDVYSATRLAAESDVTIVFAQQVTQEHFDVPTLDLPDDQNELISQVAAIARTTVVVLETGGVVLMPWLNAVAAVLAAWYPGQRGAEAIAGIVSGRVNPSGRTPVTFPLSADDLPHREVFPMPPLAGQEGPVELTLVNMLTQQQGEFFDAVYDEGLLLGYKWYEAHGLDVAFPFGHGLSFTEFAYVGCNIVAARPDRIEVEVEIENVGSVAGAETVQLYATFPQTAPQTPRRLIGWAKLRLEPGVRGTAVVEVPLKLMSVWSVEDSRWRLPGGRFVIDVAASSRDVRLSREIDLEER